MSKLLAPFLHLSLSLSSQLVELILQLNSSFTLESFGLAFRVLHDLLSRRLRGGDLRLTEVFACKKAYGCTYGRYYQHDYDPNCRHHVPITPIASVTAAWF